MRTACGGEAEDCRGSQPINAGVQVSAPKSLDHRASVIKGIPVQLRVRQGNGQGPERLFVGRHVQRHRSPG